MNVFFLGYLLAYLRSRLSIQLRALQSVWLLLALYYSSYIHGDIKCFEDIQQIMNGRKNQIWGRSLFICVLSSFFFRVSHVKG